MRKHQHQTVCYVIVVPEEQPTNITDAIQPEQHAKLTEKGLVPVFGQKLINREKQQKGVDDAPDCESEACRSNQGRVHVRNISTRYTTK